MSKPKLGSVLRQLNGLTDDNASEALSDRQLLECFAARHDEAAFAILMRRHAPMVLGVCRRVLGHDQDAEDAFQATFLVLARRACSVRWHTSVGHWLHETAYRIARHARAADTVRRVREQKVNGQARQESMAVANCRTLSSMLDDELRSLPEKYRAPLVLCYLEGQAQTAAAARLGYSEATLNRRLAEGREQLRQRLERRGITLTAALLALGLGEESRAAVPALLAKSTLKVAVAAVAGKALPEVSASVLALAAGAMHAMSTAKVYLGIVLLLGMCLLAGGGLLAYHQIAPRPEEQNVVSPARDGPDAKGQPSGVPSPDDDALPAGALARLGTLRLRQEGEVRTLAFSPDLKTLAAGSNSLTIWDAASGRVIRRFDSDAPVGALAYSADGKTLLCWMGSLRLLEAATGKELGRINNEFTDGDFFGAALSPDGKTAATATKKNGVQGGKDSDEGMIRLWDTATGRKLAEWFNPYRANEMAFSPDGKLLAAALTEYPARQRLELWDVATGTRRWQREESDLVPQPGRRQLAFSPDGKVLAAPAPGKSVILWDTASGKELGKLPGHSSAVGGLAYSPDGKIVATAATGDQSVRLWNSASGKLLREWRVNASTLAFSRDGKVLAAGSPDLGGSSMVALLDTATGEEIGPSASRHAPLQTVSCSADGNLVATAGRDDVVRLWQAFTGKEIHAFDGTSAGVSAVALAPDGKRLATLGQDGTVRVWDTATYQQLRRFDTPMEEAVRRRDFSLDGRFLIVVGQNAEVALWDVATGKVAHSVRTADGPVVAVGLAPDGNQLATGSASGNLRLWDLATGKPREWKKRRDVIPTVPPANLVFSRNGDYLVACNVDMARVFETATGEIVDEVKPQTANPPQTRVRRFEGIIVQIGGNGDIAIPSGASALSPDGRILALARGTRVHLFDLTASTELAVLSGHAARVNSLTFSADGKRLISVSADTTGLVWDVERWLPRHQRLELSRKEFIDLWDRLGDDDEATAYKAMWTLADMSPASYALLRQWLRPVTPAPEGERIARLIAALDAEDVATRTKAYEELAELGGTAAATYRRALKAKPALEVRLQLEKLLARVDRMTPERLRQLRAVTALERSGTAEARPLLASLAAGEEGAWLTEEAKHALERMDRR